MREGPFNPEKAKNERVMKGSETMNLMLRIQCEKSDKSLLFFKRVLFILFIFLTVASIITGIILWANSLVGMGFAFFFGGPAFLFLMYKIAMTFVWMMFDVKVIRTALTGSQFSEYLSTFESRSDSEYYYAKKSGYSNTPNSVKKNLSFNDQSQNQSKGQDGSQDSQGSAAPSDNGRVFAVRVDELHEKCSACGTVQIAGRSVCWECGREFERNAD